MDTNKTNEENENIGTETASTAEAPRHDHRHEAGHPHDEDSRHIHGHHHGEDAAEAGYHCRHHHHDGEDGADEYHCRHHHGEHGHFHGEDDAAHHGHRHDGEEMGDGHHGGGYSADEEGLVCPCMGTTKDEIFEAVAEGARSIEDVERATGAGTRCGRCRAAVAAVVEEALAQTA